MAIRLAFTAFVTLVVTCLGRPPAPALAQEKLDPTPRTAVISAFQPEWISLQPLVRNRKDAAINGTEFVIGDIEGRPVVLFLSGISMVNAALTAQLALDHFAISRIVFSGIAGGADPELNIGDVVVPEQWREYLETAFARETGAGYALPPFLAKPDVANFGMMFPQPVQVTRTPGEPERRTWFPVDGALLELARNAAAQTKLNDCTADHRCLAHPPRIIVGGSGVSGTAFVDNAAFRDYAHQAFHAEALDMESAAVAHVAYVNKVPFIAFRSLSDLAGGDAGENQMSTFGDLAAANSASVVKAFLQSLP